MSMTKAEKYLTKTRIFLLFFPSLQLAKSYIPGKACTFFSLFFLLSYLNHIERKQLVHKSSLAVMASANLVHVKLI